MHKASAFNSLNDICGADSPTQAIEFMYDDHGMIKIAFFSQALHTAKKPNDETFPLIIGGWVWVEGGELQIS